MNSSAQDHDPSADAGTPKRAPIREASYGSRYFDDSGWRWFVGLKHVRDMGPVVTVDVPSDLSEPDDVRAIASALNQIADILDDGASSASTTDDSRAPGMNPQPAQGTDQ